MEAAWISTNEPMNEENVVYIHSGILFICKENLNHNICRELEIMLLVITQTQRQRLHAMLLHHMQMIKFYFYVCAVMWVLNMNENYVELQKEMMEKTMKDKKVDLRERVGEKRAKVSGVHVTGKQTWAMGGRERTSRQVSGVGEGSGKGEATKYTFK